MILQGRDIQPEPSEKVRSPENNFEYVSDCFFFIQKTMSKGFSKFKASFPKLGRTKQGVDIENICHHLFQGQYVKQKGFNVDKIFDRKGIHVGSIM